MWLLLILLFADPTLAGRVSSSARRPISGAVVRAVHEGRTLAETTTDARGDFRIEVSGPFELEITGDGYRTLRSSSVALPGEGFYQVELSLLSGDPLQVETVDLEVQSSQALFSQQEPGVEATLPRADRLFGLRGGVNVTGIAEGTGQRWIAASGNVFTNSSVWPSSSFDISGPQSAAADDDVLPPGQDSFHGSAYYFHRNDIFNARNFFDPHDDPTPPFKYHFAGASAGGRVGEGTYYFGRYWGLRIRQSVTRAATVPDPRWINGDFSSVPETIVDPTTAFPFPNNRIPENRLDAVGVALARLYPAPNVPGASTQNYRAVGELATAADAAGMRMDHRLTLADEVSFEYKFARDTTEDPFNLLSGITNLPLFGVRDALRTHSFRAANTHVFSPRKVHSARLVMNFLHQPRTIPVPHPLAAGPALLITGLSNLGHAANLPQERRNRAVEISNEFAWQHPASATKLGGALRHFPFEAAIDLYSRGQFQFTNGIAGHPFANLLLGYPANALRLEGNTTRRFTTWAWNAFLEHTRQLRPGLGLTAGIRYDYQSPYKERDGLAANFDPRRAAMQATAAGLYRSDRNNFGPRLGLTWDAPFGFVGRAGYGLFYETLPVGDSLFLLGLNPPFVSFVLRNNSDVLPQFMIGDAFSGATATIPPSIFAASEDLVNPYVQHWNASLQRELPAELGLEVAYIGQKGTRLRRQINLNQPTPGPASSLDERRPFPEFRNIFQFETGASSIAHGGQIRLVRENRSGIGFTAAYRYARIIDDATLISSLPQDSRNLRAERAVADFDVQHQLRVSADLRVPAINTVPLLRGWETQIVASFESGMPLSAVLGTDWAGTGSPIVNRPDLIGDPDIENPVPSRFFDPAAFQIPQPGRFGNSGRNVIRGPGAQNVDVSISRMFRSSDLTRLQFRLDFYNVLNHPNFAPPPSLQNLVDSPDFGALFIAGSPRIVQIGLRSVW